MSIGLTPTEEKKSDANAKHANNERGQSMPGRSASESSKLSALFAGVEASVPASVGDLDIRQVACDSRKAQPRALFFALHGVKADGNAFIRDAVSRGAVAIASEDAAPTTMPTTVAWIRVAHARQALAIAAANFFGQDDARSHGDVFAPRAGAATGWNESCCGTASRGWDRSAARGEGDRAVRHAASEARQDAREVQTLG